MNLGLDAFGVEYLARRRIDHSQHQPDVRNPLVLAKGNAPYANLLPTRGDRRRVLRDGALDEDLGGNELARARALRLLHSTAVGEILLADRIVQGLSLDDRELSALYERVGELIRQP